MSMEINGNHNHTKTDYAEWVKEKQSLYEDKKVKETSGGVGAGKASDRISRPQDEYISSEKSGAKPTGLYRIGQDGDGNRKIFFDDPKKSGKADGKEQGMNKRICPDESADGRRLKANGDNSEKEAEKCTADTGKVEREIRKLKEKKQQLEQQIRSAFGKPEKVRELEKKLAQVENELSRKDNDTYRRQNATVVRG